VTGCVKYDLVMAKAPTADELANGLNKIMQKLYTRADKRSNQLRTLLDDAREKQNAAEGRRKRQQGEQMRKDIDLIRRSLYGPGNYDQEGNKKKKKYGWAWALLGIVLVLVLIFWRG